MKYIIWIREPDDRTGRLSPWKENGDGPVSETTANRILRELRAMFQLPVRALPCGQTPIEL